MNLMYLIFGTSLTLAVFTAGVSWAATINVPGDYPTIQTAVDAAASGDEIIIAPGTYQASTTSEAVVRIENKSLIVRSSDGFGVTTISGAAPSNQVGIEVTGADADCTIDGFRITNCVTDGSGAGLRATDGARVVLRNLVIDGNIAVNGGGGLFLEASPSVVMRDCRIAQNRCLQGSAAEGGGIYVRDSTFQFENLIIEGNVVERGSGAGGLFKNCVGTIVNSNVVNNNATLGAAGGLGFADNSSVTLDRCTITDNNVFADEAGGLWVLNGSSALLIDCIISRNVQSDSSSSSRGGGISVRGGGSSLVVRRGLISDNSGNSGGGISAYGSSESITLENAVVCGNSPDQISGAYEDQGGESLVASTCPLVGACCEVESCDVVTEAACALTAGQWLGEGSTCDLCPPPSPVFGACCLAGQCVSTTAERCFAAGGSYVGDGVTCAASECPTTCLGDLNIDGEVSVNDVLIIIAQFGEICP